MAKRLIQFLRSVLPADLYQLLFLLGIVLLSTLRGLRWWPAYVRVLPGRAASSFGRFVVEAGVIFLLPVLFAAAAGYFICFWPGRHPVRRILTLVVLPSVVTVILTLGRFIYLAGPPSSILQSPGAATIGKLSGIQTLGLESLGLQVALIGLLLISLFVLRLAFGISRLPLTLSGDHVEDSNELGSWRRVLAMIWFLIAFEAEIGRVFIALLMLLFPASVGMPLFLAAALNVSAVSTLAVALWIAGPEARRVVWESIAVPKYKWTGFALIFPIAVDISLSIAERNINALRSTSVESNSTLHGFSLMFVLLLLPAFFEEALFRGLLQKLFIRRYGMFRGIFLVCITWAAFHFDSDFTSPHGTYVEVFNRLFGRIVMTLCIGFVLSWLTLKSGTVVSATLCHAMYNALVISPPGFIFTGKGILRTTIWGITAIILFRLWPAPSAPISEPIPPEDAPPQAGSSGSAPASSGDDPLLTTA